MGRLGGFRLRFLGLRQQPLQDLLQTLSPGEEEALGLGAPVRHETPDVVDILDAYGKERIFIETVGVGQSELDIIENTYTTVVILVPESGDGIQTMKAGLMEIADVFVINKADREGAELLEMEIEATLDQRQNLDGWRPAVLKTCATSGKGIEAVADARGGRVDFETRPEGTTFRLLV